MKICNLLDLHDGAGRAFPVSEKLEIFLIRQGQRVFAYRNSCPHTGQTLNWLPDQFLDDSGSYIQCSGHDAMFRIVDGYCVSGPCIGQSLAPVTVVVIDGQVISRP